jgi:AcrR family transcriptional regulator
MASPRKLQIMTVARRMLAERGFDGATMADIAAEVGLVESAIYRHFRSKHDLFVETLHTFYEPLVQEMEEVEGATSDPLQLLRFIIWRHIRSYAEEPELNQLVVIQARRLSGRAGFDQEVAALNRRYTSSLTRGLARAQELGMVRADLDVRLVRDMVFGFIEHAWLSHVARGQPLDVESLTGEIYQVVLDGIRPTEELGMADQVAEMKRSIAELTRLVARLTERDGGPAPA